MSNTFSTINIGLSSLRSQSLALEVTAHNIANANTPGYSRQRAELVTKPSYTVPGMNSTPQAGQIGTGVAVDQIIQMRNSFLDQQLRQELTTYAGWDQRGDIVQTVELMMNEPSEEGLANAISIFYSQLEELSLTPDSAAVRENVRQTAEILVTTFKRVDRQLDNYQRDLNSTLAAKAAEINDLASRIADLNQQIVRIKGNNENPNDLKDQRLLLTEELANFLPISVNEDSRGAFNIAVGGYTMVQHTLAKEIELIPNPDNNNFNDLYWAGSNQKQVQINRGEIYALLEGRDSIVADFRQEIDELAKTFITDFNEIHRQGFGLNNATSIDFFGGDSAQTIALSDEINENINFIAASLIPDAPGNADNVFKLLDLRSQNRMGQGIANYEDYYRGVITRLGVMGQKAQRMKNNQELVINAMSEQREKVAGVSLDEEMSNMIRFQHAYTAASKVIVSVDEMIQTLLSMVR